MTVAELTAAVLALSPEQQQEFLQGVLEEMPVVRMNTLVKHLEDAWGVSAAAAPMMIAGPAAGAGMGEAAAETAVQTEFDVLLKEIGDSKLGVIKVVREITGLGIKEAKEIVDAVPKAIKEKVSRAEGEEIVKKLSEAGALAELK
jgi:large subunit ribosomal protein L7/L12